MKTTDFLNAINQSKKNLIRESDSEKMAAKIYNQFFVARCLSYHSDAILMVNELNIRGLREFNLTNKMHFEFLLHLLEKRKRFAKWSKPYSDEKLQLIKDYYKYSTQKALSVIDLFSEDDFADIQQKMSTGGKE